MSICSVASSDWLSVYQHFHWLHHTDAFDGSAKILGVFLNRNHIKHTHCSCTTQPYSSSAGKYRGERFCRIHILHFKHHHFSVFASVSQGWHFILVMQMFVFTVLMVNPVLLMRKEIGIKMTYSLSHKLCVLQRQSWLFGKRAVK